MLAALKFVQGAIQKNGITPELEHFRIKDGRVVGFNGYMALSAPLPLDLDAMPKATLFHKALQSCGDTIAISMTPAGRLHIKSGAFSVYVPCLERPVFDAAPQGELFQAPPGLAATFAKMLPFIGDDASRPWAMGLSIGSQTYTATNNVILLQVWDGHQLPYFNCPRFAVAEVARVKEDPVSIQVDTHSVTFHYSDGRWLRTQLLEQEWPVDKMNSILNRESSQKPLPDGFFEAVNQIAPFAGDAGPAAPVYFGAGVISTGVAGSEEGAVAELPGIPEGPAFKVKALQMLSGVMDTIDFSMHPNPCMFFGANARGALIGMAY